MRASNALNNRNFPDRESVTKAISQGLKILEIPGIGKGTAQEILDWIGTDRGMIQPKWEIISPGKVKIGRWTLGRSQVIEILAAME